MTWNDWTLDDEIGGYGWVSDGKVFIDFGSTDYPNTYIPGASKNDIIAKTNYTAVQYEKKFKLNNIIEWPGFDWTEDNGPIATLSVGYESSNTYIGNTLPVQFKIAIGDKLYEKIILATSSNMTITPTDINSGAVITQKLVFISETGTDNVSFQIQNTGIIPNKLSFDTSEKDIYIKFLSPDYKTDFPAEYWSLNGLSLSEWLEENTTEIE